jgi:3-ketosteroid 9alpha-monooxygenase subunit B
MMCDILGHRLGGLTGPAPAPYNGAPMIRPRTVTATVSKVIRETPDTVTLRLGLDGQPFDYRAGMAVNFDPRQFPALADEIARREAVAGRPEMPRAFSLASSPLEREFVEITVKEEATADPKPLLSPLFVRGLRPGDKVSFVGPFGLYVLPEPIDPVIEGILYIAAGSGVAPNRGILKHCLAAGMPQKHLFMVQNKTAADIIYAAELEGIAMLNPDKVRLVNVLSRDPAAAAAGVVHGHIDAPLIRRELASFASSDRVLAFVCGPNKPRPGHARGFVDSFAGNRRRAEPGILAELGIPPTRIVTETW